MKTSNKILLGIFLTIIFITTAVQLMVYAKYKRGEYVAFDRDKIIKVASVKIPATRFVSIKNLGNCVLINSDTSRFETDQDKAGRINYRVINDTLVIHGDPTLRAEELERGERNFQLVKIYLPAGVQVNATSCNIYINGAVDSVHAPSYSIQLEKKSQLDIRQHNDVDTYFNRLLINCERSGISLDNDVIVNELNLKLEFNSFADYQEAKIRKMTLDMDSRSRISLSGYSFNALK